MGKKRPTKLCNLGRDDHEGGGVEYLIATDTRPGFTSAKVIEQKWLHAEIIRRFNDYGRLRRELAEAREKVKSLAIDEMHDELMADKRTILALRAERDALRAKIEKLGGGESAPVPDMPTGEQSAAGDTTSGDNQHSPPSAAAPEKQTSGVVQGQRSSAGAAAPSPVCECGHSEAPIPGMQCICSASGPAHDG